MRRLTLVPAAAALSVAVLVIVLTGGSRTTDAPAAAPTRTVEVGDVEISATPLRVDDDSVVFRLVFDTHSTDLDFDPTTAVTLETPAGTVAAVGWDGPGPGGHHREGELRFDTGGTVEQLVLRIDLGEPVTLDWKDERS